MAVETSTKISIGKGGEERIASASKGLSCTDTAAFLQFPRITERVTASARNFATSAVVVRLLFNPWLVILKTTDGMIALPTDYSNVAQDNDTSTSMDVSELSTRANGDFLLMGSHLPFRGVYFDVDGTNSAGTATVTIYYWDGSAWADTSATVTGIRSTMVWDQDGLAYWTVPTAWQAATIRDLYPTMTVDAYYKDVPLYWTRWEVDAAITDTSVTFDRVYAANRSTAYMEIASGQMISKDIHHGFGGTGCLEALTDTGTANLIVNAITRGAFE